MPTLGETNIYRVWAAKQSAKGTPATVPTRSFKQVAGAVVTAVDTGSENFSDGTSFGDTTTWLNSITGTGSPGIEGTTDETAWLLWMFHGTETITVTGTNAVMTLSTTGMTTSGSTLSGGTSPTASVANTTPGVNFQHQTVAGGTAGFWLTWWQTVGQTTIQRLEMNDGRISSLTMEASTGTKALRITPALLFVDPAQAYSVDPTPGMPTAPVMFYTEGAGQFQVDGTTFTGQSQFQITLNLDLSFVYGDNVTPFDLQRGNVGATIAATLLFDDTFLAKWNVWLYGTATPSPGQKPLGRIPPVGSYSCLLTKKDSGGNTIGTFSATFPGVQWDLPDSPAPNPDQGSAEVSLSGRLQKLPGITTLYTFLVGCQQPAFTG
jgi:hypothetical protein